MNLLFTICARSGSKGVKNKNIKNFLEYPIVYYTLSAYHLFLRSFSDQYNQIHLAVNTDSSELINQITRTNVVFEHIPRKDELAGDFVSKTDVIKDSVKKMEEKLGCNYDMVIDLDLTSPLRTVEDIKGMIDTLQGDLNADVVCSVANARRLPFFNMIAAGENGYFLPLINKGYISRQQAPQCFDMNASIYAYRKEFITSEYTNKVFDGKALTWLMKDTAVLDIDCEEDMELMQVLAEYFFSKYDAMGKVYHGINDLIKK